LEHYYKFDKEDYVESVFPYIAGSLDYTTPNDTYFSNQWYLTKINISSVWDITTGNSNVKIVVLDSGIPLVNGNLLYDDLKSSIIKKGSNYSGFPGNIVDNLGHGTHIAGIIGAETNI